MDEEIHSFSQVEHLCIHLFCTTHFVNYTHRNSCNVYDFSYLNISSGLLCVFVITELKNEVNSDLNVCLLFTFFHLADTFPL